MGPKSVQLPKPGVAPGFPPRGLSFPTGGLLCTNFTPIEVPTRVVAPALASPGATHEQNCPLRVLILNRLCFEFRPIGPLFWHFIFYASCGYILVQPSRRLGLMLYSQYEVNICKLPAQVQPQIKLGQNYCIFWKMPKTVIFQDFPNFQEIVE